MTDHRPFDERIVVEPGQVEFNEHSKHSRAKKTVEVFPNIPAIADGTVTLTPTEIAGAAGEFSLEPGKAYRLISNGDLRIRLATITAAADAADTYIPADNAVIIKAGTFTKLTFARMTGNFTQLVEVR